LAAALQAAGAAREIPAPIRAFVREADRTGSEVATALTAAATSVGMIALLETTNRAIDFMGGLTLAVEQAAYLALAAGTTGLAGARLARLVARARGLLQSGYGHSATRPALASAEQHLEDEAEPGVSGIRRVAEAVLGVGGMAGCFFLAGMGGTAIPLLGIAGSVAIPAMMIRRLLETRQGRGGLWSRTMRGSVGKAMFTAAGVGLDTDTLKLPAAGEPTSFALRSELTSLFDALPAGPRGEFSDVPAIALRLESQADALRERTPSPETDRRLQSVVAALDLLRLDLLRLNAAAIELGIALPEER